MKDLPILIVSSFQAPLLRLAERIGILPLIPPVWEGRHEQIRMLIPEVQPDLGFTATIDQIETFRSTGWPDWVNEEALLHHFFQYGRQINGILELLEALDQEINLCGAVLHNDVEPVFRAVAQWTNAKGIPAIHVPHAHYFGLWRDERGWDVHDVVTAPHIAAINDVQARWYQARGARHVRVCGRPEWDTWAKWNVPTAKARKLLGIELDQPTVSYLASWSQSTSLFGEMGDYPYLTFSEFCGAVKGLGWNMVLSFHPSSPKENNERHMEIAKQIGISGIATGEHFGLVLQASDVVASFGPSNALIEASILGKPGLCVGGEDQLIASVPPNADAISGMLMELRGKEASPGVRNLAAHVGEATQRVADYIAEVCLDASSGD